MTTKKERDNERLRKYRKRTNNAATKKYEKTKKGFLMRTYRNMLSRVSGVQKLKRHLYHGKELLPRDQFYEWSLASNTFHSLFADWEVAQYSQKLTPSINRIDPERGYAVNNIEWLTHSENSRQGAINRHKKHYEQTNHLRRPRPCTGTDHGGTHNRTQ